MMRLERLKQRPKQTKMLKGKATLPVLSLAAGEFGSGFEVGEMMLVHVYLPDSSGKKIVNKNKSQI